MTTQEVADRYYELSQTGDYNKIQEELYAEHAVSIEPNGAPVPRVEGMDAIRKKGEMWNDMMEEFHGGFTDKPIVAGSFFTCRMGFDATYKNGKRSKEEEIALFKVEEGKIVLEQFFYDIEPS